MSRGKAMHHALSRREGLKLLGGATIAPLLGGSVALRSSRALADAAPSHGLSVFGELKYPADFTHFQYAYPDAPIGGTFTFQPGKRAYNQNFLTFNSFNSFILRGDGPLLMENTFASLMSAALDEPDAMYGLLARDVRFDPQSRLLGFDLRPEAVFHDGTPITAADVVESFRLLKKDGYPSIAQALNDVEEARAEGEHTVHYRLKEGASRDLPLTIAALPVFSKAYYATHSFADTTLVPPLGSGGFRVGAFEQGRYVEYERVKEWWGWKLPVRRGIQNWNKVRIEYYGDRTASFEAFKKGELVVREEFTSRIWATGYDFPAINEGRVKRAVLEDATPSGAQGYFLNLRRARFADPKVREALICAFDFEWSNTNLFYGLYRRTHSFFQNSAMMASGKPSEEELALLEPFREQLPADVFDEPFTPPVSDGSGSDRTLLRRASLLLKEAGVKIEGGKAKLASGEPLTIEFLADDPVSERITLPYIRNLAALGIEAKLRRVDATQFQARVKDFDFDVVAHRYSLGLTPGDMLKRLFTSQTADLKGSDNLSGIKHPAIDALVEKAVQATSRDELTTACRALDRVLRAQRAWVPQWYSGRNYVAYWDQFGQPGTKPLYDTGMFQTWWIDADKARAIGRER